MCLALLRYQVTWTNMTWNSAWWFCVVLSLHLCNYPTKAIAAIHILTPVRATYYSRPDWFIGWSQLHGVVSTTTLTCLVHGWMVPGWVRWSWWLWDGRFNKVKRCRASRAQFTTYAFGWQNAIINTCYIVICCTRVFCKSGRMNNLWGSNMKACGFIWIVNRDVMGCQEFQKESKQPS